MMKVVIVGSVALVAGTVAGKLIEKANKLFME